MKAMLSKELRAKYKKKSLNLRKGDTVQIIKGKFSGKEGLVENIVKNRALIEGIQTQKTDGTKAKTTVSCSNLMIKKMELTDKKRKEKIEGDVKHGKAREA